MTIPPDKLCAISVYISCTQNQATVLVLTSEIQSRHNIPG